MASAAEGDTGTSGAAAPATAEGTAGTSGAAEAAMDLMGKGKGLNKGLSKGPVAILHYSRNQQQYQVKFLT